MQRIGRHQGRCLALQLLYQWDFNMESLDKLYQQLAEAYPMIGRDSFTWSLVQGVLENRQQLDTIIGEKAENWKLSRLSFVDRNILRLALYEILYLDEIPSRVTVNEAVELAKEFSGEKSSAFVNGILGSLLREDG